MEDAQKVDETPSGNSKNEIRGRYEALINAPDLREVLEEHRKLCELLNLKPDRRPHFYPSLKKNLTFWKAQALFKKFDQKANSECYGNGLICSKNNVLIIGAGPCGLRAAIEAQLLGAKVIVVEKRNSLTRHNILRLWPFVIEDLKNLGAKKFLGKFCAGSINHISTRKLQCILLKICLLLGVEIHINTSFEDLLEPDLEKGVGWRAKFKLENHSLSDYEFDVIIGAPGKKDFLNFKRKELRRKLAIAITANFVNTNTEAEAQVEEISGVSCIYKQDFFKNMNAQTGIDLENIVYYKGDTHYFIMTAKKQSLLRKGVLKQDFPDATKLLSSENVAKDALLSYATEAARFSTDNKLPISEFALNHRNEPDAALFDFTAMYQAEHASKVIERNTYKLLAMLVGDSLFEPFWPTGSGCARGFLSSLDASWALREWGINKKSCLEILAERESIYLLLPQTNAENLNKDHKSYSLDPSTRYVNLNKNTLSSEEVRKLYDGDNSTERQPKEVPVQNEIQDHKKETADEKERIEHHLKLLEWANTILEEYDEIGIQDLVSLETGKTVLPIIRHFRPDLVDYNLTNSIIQGGQNIAFNRLDELLDLPSLTAEEAAVFSGKLHLLYLYKIFKKYGYEQKETKCESMHRINENVAKSHLETAGSVLEMKKEFYEKTKIDRDPSVQDVFPEDNSNNYLHDEPSEDDYSIKYYKKIKSVKRSKDCAQNSNYIQKLRLLKRIMSKYYEQQRSKKEIKVNTNSKPAISKNSRNPSRSTVKLAKCRKHGSKHSERSEKRVDIIFKNEPHLCNKNYSSSEIVHTLHEKDCPTPVDGKKSKLYLHSPKLKIEKLENTIPEELYDLKPKKDTKACSKKSTHLVITEKMNATSSSALNGPDVLIQSLERIEAKNVCLTEIKYWSSLDRVTISPKIIDNWSKSQNFDAASSESRREFGYEVNKFKVPSLCTMSDKNAVSAEVTRDRVTKWLKHSDFDSATDCNMLKHEKPCPPVETNLDVLTDITSITKEIERKLGNPTEMQVKSESSESIAAFKNNLKLQKPVKKHSNTSSWELYHGRVRSRSEPRHEFATIVENEEAEPIDTKLKKSKSSLTKTKQCAHSDCKLKSRIENHPDTVSSKKCKCRSKNPASDNGSFGWWPVSLELNSLLMQSALCIIITLIFLYLLDYIIYLILFIYFCSKIIRQ